jgi:hypothetical protein
MFTVYRVFIVLCLIINYLATKHWHMIARSEINIQKDGSMLISPIHCTPKLVLTAELQDV